MQQAWIGLVSLGLAAGCQQESPFPSGQPQAKAPASTPDRPPPPPVVGVRPPEAKPLPVEAGPLPQSIPLPRIFGNPDAPVRAPSPPAGDAGDPSGAWKWTVNFGDGSFEYLLKLRLDGDRLSGTLARGDREPTPIDNAVFRDGELSFTVTRVRNNGEKSLSKYTGRLSGNAIRGTYHFDSGNRSRDWEAVRVN